VFFVRMSQEEPPYLTVASRGNRTWVQFDPDGTPVRVLQPLKAGYPFADILVGPFQSNLKDGRKYGFDLANRALVVLDESYSAGGSYVISNSGRTFALTAAAFLLVGLAISLSRFSLAAERVKIPFFFKLLALFIPLLVFTAKFVGNSVNQIMREDVNSESLRRSANLAQAVVNSLTLNELQAIQTPGDRESPTYEKVHNTISRLVDGQRVEQTPKWILHKIRDGHYYFGINIWRGAIFQPFIVSKERKIFFRVLQEKTPQHGLFVDDQGEWFSYLHPILDQGGNVIYVLELYRPAEELERAQRQASIKVNQVVAVTAIITALLVLIFSYVFTRPLRRLMRGTEIIRQGNFDFNVGVDSRDELGDLARAFNRMVVDLKSYTRELARTTAEKESIQNELRLARQLQQGMLPRVFPPLPGAVHVTMYAEMEPAREVGGDYYDFFFVDDSHLGVVVADVSGKGVPAGLFMMRIRAMLRGSAIGTMSPADTLARINQLIAPENPSAMFVTLFYFICDLDTGRITYC
ncbi:MAG: SpoIIE family protein phosphatase, partial [Deltaproteobacteria bacterium]|nr:SpoIIE family protein phosphatase [Deltaproteobacteria bacterium]